MHTPAVCGDTLVAAVLLVPVFAVHGRVGAAGADADAPAGGWSHAGDRGHVHLNLHLRDEKYKQLLEFKCKLDEMHSVRPCC